jgi:hypothetical protein
MRNQDAGNTVPFITIEKTRFILKESVFFWIGVKQEGKHERIPKALQSTCRLTITRPDGQKIVQPISWPKDGLLDSPWMGGWGLPKPILPGRYTLVFAFAGQSSAPATLTVEPLPLLENIEATFVFESVPSGDTPITLSVHNKTNQTLRFSQPDIWAQLTTVSEQRVVQVSSPTKTLRPVTVKPGERYQERLSLRTAVERARQTMDLPPGKYQVRFETTLPLLVGEPGGAYAALSPVRLPVRSTATCTIP